MSIHASLRWPKHRKDRNTAISGPFSFKKNDLTLQMDSSGNVVLLLQDVKNEKEKKDKKKEKKKRSDDLAISEPTGFKKVTNGTETLEEGEDMVINIKFPEGYPFEQKNVQFNTAWTAGEIIQLIQTHLNLYEDLTREFGFYIPSKDIWLDSDKSMLQYKGIQFLSHLEYRERPENEETPVKSPSPPERSPERARSPEPRPTTHARRPLSPPSRPAPPPPQPQIPSTKQESFQRTQSEFTIPKKAPPPAPRALSPPPRTPTSSIPVKPSPPPPEPQVPSREALEEQLAEYHELLEEGGQFLAKLQEENEDMKVKLKVQQEINEELRMEMEQKDRVIAVQAAELVTLRQKLKELSVKKDEKEKEATPANLMDEIDAILFS